jgi:hypothetical protein
VTTRKAAKAAAKALLLELGYRPGPLVRSASEPRWWGLAQDDHGRWALVRVRESLAESERSTYDPTSNHSDVWAADPLPALHGFTEVEQLILAVIRHRRTTTIAGQWERRAVIAYLDGLPSEERSPLEKRLESVEPAGWETLQGLRRYEENLAVDGRQAEAVQLLKSTLRRLWPQTMTEGRLTQFGKRSGDEVFMVLPYDSWEAMAEHALRRVAEDPATTTGSWLRYFVPTQTFDVRELS